MSAATSADTAAPQSESDKVHYGIYHLDTTALSLVGMKRVGFVK
jgi:hypothetical protein